jgi:DNA uptake protein ComE-like DNA-binding protein
MQMKKNHANQCCRTHPLPPPAGDKISGQSLKLRGCRNQGVPRWRGRRERSERGLCQGDDRHLLRAKAGVILNDVSGSVLIVTIWVVLVLTGLTLVFCRAMRVEAIASANHISSLKAEEIAKGAIPFIKARLAQTDTTLKLDGETPYKAIAVGDGYFWLLRPNLGDTQNYYFGIQDEAAKVNLNKADYDMLMTLPDMTSELAASITAWRNPPGLNPYGGAESEYYLLLDNPYYCKNSSLETVEETLLIKGASQQILYGQDRNLNGVFDSIEKSANNVYGTFDRGFYDYTTVYSIEPNTASDRTQRTNVTSTNKNQLFNIVKEAKKDIDQWTWNNFFRPNTIISSVLDFYNKLHNNFGLTAEQFKQIEDKLTSDSGTTVTGRINVNTASKEVLMCLPGIEEADADALISKREADGTDTGSITWVYDALGATKAVAIGNDITIRSYQYSADIVAASGDGRSFARYKMIVDTRDDQFKIVYWKSLKHSGWPLDPEILSKLRAGESIAN